MMSDEAPASTVGSPRVLILGLVAVIVVLGLALITLAISRPSPSLSETRVNALAASDDACVVCHTRTTPGIVAQYHGRRGGNLPRLP